MMVWVNCDSIGPIYRMGHPDGPCALFSSHRGPARFATVWQWWTASSWPGHGR